MDWLRWHHGTVTDPKWRVIARKSGCHLATVICVWAAMLEHGCKHKGKLTHWNDEDCAEALDIAPQDVAKIRLAMQGRLLVGSNITGWRRGKSPFPMDQSRPAPDEWIALRGSVFERDSYTCRYCGARGGKLECDHVIPVSRGGGHEESNLVTACFKCNRAKRDRTPEEWKRA